MSRKSFALAGRLMQDFTTGGGGQGDMTWNSQVVEQDLSCRTEQCARCHGQQQHLRARMNLHVHQSSDAEILKKKKKKRLQHLSRLLMNLSKQEKLIIGNHQISSDKWLMTLVLLQRVIVLLNFEKSMISRPSGCLMEMFSTRQLWWKGHKDGLKCRKETSTRVQLAQQTLRAYSNSLTPFSSQDHSSYLYLANACLRSCSRSESQGWPLSWRVWWTLKRKWSLRVDCVALSTFLSRGNCGEIGMTGLQLHYSQSCSFSLEAIEPSSLLSVTLIFSV